MQYHRPNSPHISLSLSPVSMSGVPRSRIGSSFGMAFAQSMKDLASYMAEIGQSPFDLGSRPYNFRVSLFCSVLVDQRGYYESDRNCRRNRWTHPGSPIRKRGRQLSSTAGADLGVDSRGDARRTNLGRQVAQGTSEARGEP